MTSKKFRETLRRLRKAKGLTQTELAERAGFNRVYVTQLETQAGKNPSLDALHRLAKALGVAVTELLG